MARRTATGGEADRGRSGLAAATRTANQPAELHARHRCHLLAVGSLEDDWFVVPNTLPYSTRDVEPATYSWCHGPTGTSHLFAALAHAGVDEVAGLEVAQLRQRRLNSILTSGVARRLRPGFWGNDRRCCGTVGAADVLLDAA